MTVLWNIQTLLRDTEIVVHVMAECFAPNKAGLKIYQVENSCDEISAVLQTAGYETHLTLGRISPMSDVVVVVVTGTTRYLQSSASSRPPNVDVGNDDSDRLPSLSATLRIV